MKVYEFTSVKYGTPKLGLEEYEVEEKPKTYIFKNRRFNKEDIGKVSGHGMSTVLLIENNPSLAAQLLIEQKQKEYKQIEEQLKRKDDELKMLLKYVK